MRNNEQHIWKILLVDDDEEDYILTRDMLANNPRNRFVLEWESSYSAGQKAIVNNHYDAILVDYDLGIHNGIDLIRQASDLALSTPLILMTGRGKYELDLEAMQAGAVDYLSKNETDPVLLERAIRYAIERKQNEQKIKQQRQEISDILHSISDGFFVLDRDWNFIYINERAAANTGKRPEDLIGKNIWEEFPALKSGILWNNYHEAMEKKMPVRFEMAGTSSRNTWYDIAVYPTAGGISIYWVDITERKALENALRRSEERFHHLADAMPQLVWTASPEGSVDYYNDRSEEYDGLIKNEDGTVDWQAIIHPDDQEPSNTVWQRSIQTEEPYKIEHRVRTKTQGYRWHLSRAVPIHDDTGQVVKWYGTSTDIHDIKQAEEALRASEQRERSRANEMEVMMDSVPALVWITHDAQSRQMTGNRLTYEFLRMNRGENISRSAPSEEVPVHFCAMKDGCVIPTAELPVQTAAAKGITLRGYEFDLVFNDGATYHLLGNATPLLDSNGEPAGAVSAFIDITARKKVEKALLESEERYRQLFDLSPDTIFIHSEGCFVFINHAGLRLFGAERPDQILGRNVLDLVHPDDRATVAARLLALKTGQKENPQIEERFLRLDSSPVYVETVSAPFVYKGQPGALIIVRDISQRKEAELALKESSERLAFTAETTGIGFWDWDLIKNELCWDTNCRELFGLSPEEPVDSFLFQNLLQKEEAERIQYELQQSVANHGTYETEYYAVRKDGQERRFYSRSQGVYNQQGIPVRVVGIVMDVTTRYQLENNSRENAARIEVQRKLIEQREQERLQVARDLHDGPLQQMIGILYNLQEMAAQEESQPILAELNDIKRIVQEQISELRSYASNLRPPMLANFGLEKAIRSHIREFEEKHPEIRMHFESRQTGNLLPDDQRLALYRIYQELMNNIVKHARATEVSICFYKNETEAELLVEDNGSGFILPKEWVEFARQKHLGLVGIQERAEAVGGRVSVYSRPGEGTTVLVTIPLFEPEKILE